MPEAVFFDLDGTLIDTAPDMGGALNRMLEKRRRAPVAASAYRSSVSHGSIALLKLGFPELVTGELPETELQKLKPEFLATYAGGVCIGSQLFDGIPALLQEMDERQIPWGIITNKPEGLTIQLLEALELRSRCCSIVGADTTTHAKPHPAPMRLACEMAGVDPASCFYVGDAERDIQAGKAVNMTTFIAGWGYIDEHRDTPQSWGAHAYLNNPQEIVDQL